MNTINKICVFCGSSSGTRQEYSELASALGHELASRKIGLVYGGAKIGLMGTVADAVMADGGNVIGVIPKTLHTEVGHDGISELHVVDSMHTRKQKMYELSDAFIALPGGLGTFDEFFEILTWIQLGFYRKPCGLLNISGYYDKLLDFLEHTVEEKFVRRAHKDMIIIESSPEKLITRLINAELPELCKWGKQ